MDGTHLMTTIRFIIIYELLESNDILHLLNNIPVVLKILMRFSI